MHFPQCVMENRNCLMGEGDHCARCPQRGFRNNPRYILVQRLKMWAYSVEKGYPALDAREKMGPDLAAILWPDSEREWIEREDRWVERASYHAEMATKSFLREVLVELHDARAAIAAITKEGT